mmetsp:Transcript_40487/g.114682  ORF Transcript_40487/g.114682 Transcript_40487/m.114682 type:complete len:202 (-) Transcript_40487:629-1234(-)
MAAHQDLAAIVKLPHSVAVAPHCRLRPAGSRIPSEGVGLAQLEGRLALVQDRLGKVLVDAGGLRRELLDCVDVVAVLGDGLRRGLVHRVLAQDAAFAHIQEQLVPGPRGNNVPRVDRARGGHQGRQDNICGINLRWRGVRVCQAAHNGVLRGGHALEGAARPGKPLVHFGGDSVKAFVVVSDAAARQQGLRLTDLVVELCQ